MQNCGHGAADNQLCTHIANKTAKAHYKLYTGDKNRALYLCQDCLESAPESDEILSQCWYCFTREQSEIEFAIRGECAHSPQYSFSFAQRKLQLCQPQSQVIISAHFLATETPQLIAIDNEGVLWRICTATGLSESITRLDELAINSESGVQLKFSDCSRYAAISVLNREPAYNAGLVLALEDGRRIMPLPDYNYHSTHTPYPVCFYRFQEKTYLIYASSWSQLDIVDLASGECLSAREEEDQPQIEPEDRVFSEWSGELKISPDGRRLATIGWCWHPMGMAYGFSIEDWLTHNKWEPDSGKSKVIYAGWEYFWDSPFCWLDNQRLLIWGNPYLQTHGDIPENSAVIYDAISAEEILSFLGPTLDIFFAHGDFLFSGSPAQDGLSIWHLQTGEFLDEHPCKSRILSYHPGSQTFLTRDQQGDLGLLQWSSQ